MSLLKNCLIWVWLFTLAVVQAAGEILPADKVFIPAVTGVTEAQITIDIDIKPAYYLYRQRLFSVTSDDITITDVRLSDGIDKTDAFFGTQSVWYGGKNTARIVLAYHNPQASGTAALRLKYQGCQDGVICYPPQTVTLPVQLPAVGKKDKQPPGQDLFANNAANNAPDSLFAEEKNRKVLPEEQAFPFYLEFSDDTTLTLQWKMPDGYYLYRDKIKIKTPNVADIQFSPSETHYDEFFGEQAIYRGDKGIVQVNLKQQPTEQFLNLTFQGCADKGICYPLMKHRVQIGAGKVQAVAWQNELDSTRNKVDKTSQPTKFSIAKITSKFQALIARLTRALTHNKWVGFALLFLAGVSLSFTPCVLPMLPILLGIITNQRQMSKSRSAVLSSAYALGVAVMMAVFGLVVAKTGINLQIIFQKPLWLILFATIFMLMGAAMFGMFNIALPNRLQTKIYQWQNRFQDSKVSHLFMVGALSTLVVGPCVAPPLVAVLAFIATTNNSVLGALYLFALGLGMSLPLVIFATVVTTVPKTGAFSRLLTRVFALLMFAVGLWLLSRLLPGALALLLWGLLMFVAAWIFWRSDFIQVVAKKMAQGVSVACLLLGITWAAGGLMGNSNPLKPFTKVMQLSFQNVGSLAQLQQMIADSQQPVMLDLYADWCVSCHELEYTTFTDPEVAAALQQLTLLKLDITDNNAEHREILKALGLIGPPALLFFQQGKEVKRHIGVIGPEALLAELQRIGNM